MGEVMDWIKQNAISICLMVVSAFGVYTKISIDQAVLERRVTEISSNYVTGSEYRVKVSQLERNDEINVGKLTVIEDKISRLEDKVVDNTIASERMAVAIENLIKVTHELNNTVYDLGATAARLDEKTKKGL